MFNWKEAVTMALDFLRSSIKMPRQCQVTKKKSSVGKRYSIRGIAKKKKGIGLKITGITKRKFSPNLFKKKFWFAEENRFVSIRISAHGMRVLEKTGLARVVRKMRKEGKRV